MAFARTITFRANPEGVTPTGLQAAGVQGDHNAAAVVWKLEGALVNAAYRYRCEYVDGAGGWDTTRYLPLESGNTLTVPLPRAWTAAGGCAAIRLCVSEFVSGEEEHTLYTLTGRLQFANRESGGAMAAAYEEKLPALIQAVSVSIEEADTAAGTANTAATAADAAKARADTAANAANQAANGAREAALAANQAASLATADGDARYAGAVKGRATGMMAVTADASDMSVLHRLALFGSTRELGSGTKGPDNPFPITGLRPHWVGATGGRNLIPPYVESGSANGLTWTVDGDGVIHVSGTATAKTLISLLPNKEIPYFWLNVPCYGINSASRTMTLKVVDINGVNSWRGLGGSAPSASFPGVYGAVTAYYTYNKGETVEDDTLYPYIGLEAGQPYEPFAGSFAALPELEPLYGDGTVNDEYDAATGVLTRRWKRLELTGFETFVAHSTSVSGKYEYELEVPDIAPGALENTVSNAVCSHYQTITEGQIWRCQTGMAVGSGDTHKLKFYDDSIPGNHNLFRQYLRDQVTAGTPVTVVYQLEQPEKTLYDRSAVRLFTPVSRVYGGTRTLEAGYSQDVAALLARLEGRVAALENT